ILAGDYVPLMIGNGANLMGAAKINVTTTTPGVSGANKEQQFAIGSSNHSNANYEFKMTFSGASTPWIPIGIGGKELQIQLEQLPGIGRGNVSVDKPVQLNTYT